MKYDDVKKELLKSPKKWLVTSMSGFIESNLEILVMEGL